MSKIKKDRVNEDIFIPDLVNQYKNAITTLFKTVSFEMDSFGAKCIDPLNNRTQL